MAGDAGPDLPRLPAARHRQQRLQRQRRAGAGAAGPRGPSPLPGRRGRLAPLDRCRRTLGGRRLRGRADGKSRDGRGRNDHRLSARHRRAPARLRRRPLRGIHREDVPRVRRRGDRGLHRRQRDRGQGRGRAGRRDRRRSRQPPGDGAGDPRPQRPAVRGEGPRQRPLLHGDPAPRALPPLCARGDGGGPRRPGRLSTHRRVAVADARPRGTRGEDAARASRRGCRRVLAVAPVAGSGRATGRSRRRSDRRSPALAHPVSAAIPPPPPGP